MKKYDLAIAHRVCPVLAKTASHFDDKLKMIEATTASLASALEGIRGKVTIILDGCGKEYKELFDKSFAPLGNAYRVIETPKIGNLSTYNKQLEVLLDDAAAAEFLYFSEDDYIYRKDAFVAMMDFLRRDGVDFVTPLDHPDRYSLKVPGSRRSEIRVSDFCHWREVGTTCCTFMTKSHTLVETQKLLADYGRGSGDSGMWLRLTKDNMFAFKDTVGAMWRYLTGRRTTAEGLEFVTLAAWKYYKWKLPFGKRYRLWGPIPSLAVHLCKPSLPPLYEALLK